MKCFSIAIVGCALVGVSLAGDKKTVPLAEVAQHAVEQSKLTLPGSSPFHLKATIVETTNPDSTYKAEIEEYWVSPEKWRRTIASPDFSQILIANGDQVWEQDKGDYFPWWLNDLITAIFDPLPMLDGLSKVSASMQKPSGSEHSNSCARLQTKVGTPPAQNSAFLVFCFEGNHGLLNSVFTPGYHAEFKDYRAFKAKQVARRFVIYPEPGTTIEAKITELEELQNPDEGLFAIQQSTPAAERIGRTVVSDATLRSLLISTPDIVWPTVRSSNTSGVLSMYISLDRNGHVREAWPMGPDNAGLEDPAREQVMGWEFKPVKTNGIPVQAESVLTLAFNTKIGDPITILADEEARKLATNIVEPTFPPGTPKGTEVGIEVGVTLDGTVNGVSNHFHVPTPLFMAAYGAVQQWRFRPYLRNGKPDIFGADIIFRAP